MASSVCRSLQCLISALTQGGKGGPSFRLTRSLANKPHWRVWGALAVSQPHWVFPAHGLCAVPVYAAQAPGCSAGNCLKRALGCVRFPGLSPSGSGSRVLPKGADSVRPAFVPFPGVSCSGEQVLGERPLLRCGPSLLNPRPRPQPPLPSQPLGFPNALCVSSGELISDCNPPGGCQPSRIPGSFRWQLGACSQFGGGCYLWG